MAGEQAVKTAEELTASMQRMAGELAEANRYGKRSRHMIWFTIASVALDIALTIIVTFALAAAHHAQVTVTELHSTQVSGCQAGNQTRAAEVNLWEYIYRLGVTSKTPPKIRREDNELIAHVRDVFAPRDCNALYRLP